MFELPANCLNSSQRSSMSLRVCSSESEVVAAANRTIPLRRPHFELNLEEPLALFPSTGRLAYRTCKKGVPLSFLVLRGSLLSLSLLLRGPLFYFQTFFVRSLL